MDRRRFLSLPVVAAAPAIPAVARSVQTPIERAIGFFEANFDCAIGWPAAYMYPSLDRDAYMADEYTAEQLDDAKRTVYRSIVLSASDDRLGRAMLAGAVEGVGRRIMEVLPLVRGSKLYWRLPEKIKFAEQDSGMVSIRTRIAIPAFEYHWPILEAEGLIYTEGQRVRRIT